MLPLRLKIGTSNLAQRLIITSFSVGLSTDDKSTRRGVVGLTQLGKFCHGTLLSLSAKLVDGRALLTAPAMVDDRRCYILSVHSRQSSVVCVDNTWWRWWTMVDVTTYCQQSSTTVTCWLQCPVLCTARWAIGCDGVARSVGVSWCLLISSGSIRKFVI